jgi:hypothetical protein
MVVKHIRRCLSQTPLQGLAPARGFFWQNGAPPAAGQPFVTRRHMRATRSVAGHGSDKAALSDARWNLNPGLTLVMWARRHSRWPATLIVIFPPATCPNRSRKSCGLCFNAVRSLTYSMRAPASASAGSSAAPLSIPRPPDGIQVGLSKLARREPRESPCSDGRG